MARMIRVAYFSPLAPMRTSISHYSEELLPQLCRRAHIDVYTDDRIAAAQEVGRIYPLYGYRDFAQAERYDQLIFQVGNSPEHVPIYDQFMHSGGVAVLHDLDVSEIIGAKTLRQGDGWGYLKQVKCNEGLGPFLRTAGGALLRGQWPQPQQGGTGGQGRLAVTRALVQRAAGLIVHSRAVRERLLARYPAARVCVVPLAIRRPPAVDPAEARQLLNLPAGAFICLSVGRLGPDKRIHVALQAFARLLERCPDSLYVLVGEAVPGYPLEELAQALGVADRVRLAGYVDLATLYRYLAACDVGIGLRDPERGEASASLLRIMSMGRPVVVSNCASHAQFPGDSALKIDPGAGEIAQMTAALWAVCGHLPLREWYGRRAARYVQANHSPAAAARQYVEFLEELAAVEAAEEILLRDQGDSHRRTRPFERPALIVGHGQAQGAGEGPARED